ncbi:DUF4924 family protein [Prevotella sp.]|uniref:DUF4924 family protein n=1 Tax=Prevotella sp. TaxID=59823 RepID=UPI002F92D583
MYIAQELRKKSIAEYLLYMWQIEDLIRAYDCYMPAIRKQYIDRFDYTPEQKDEMIDWYGNLVRMMNEEGKREYGHLNINEILMKDLLDLHARLLRSSKFPFYSAAYYKVLPFVVELRGKNRRSRTEEENAQAENESEVETCFDALYGVMLLKLQKKEITPDTSHAIKEITTFIGLLSDYYIKDRDEGLDFGDE